MSNFVYWQREANKRNLVMCMLCFYSKPIEDMYKDSNGDIWDVCTICHIDEEKRMIEMGLKFEDVNKDSKLESEKPKIPSHSATRTPKVLNKRTDPFGENAVYVGRPTPFGNPFDLNHNEARRDVVCNQYEHWIMLPEQELLRDMMKAKLKGKDLVCFCAPKRCHADTILRIANE